MPPADILLTHGYFIAEDAHEQKIMKPYPPLGLLYISAHLKAKQFAVDVFDSTFATLETFEAHVAQTKPQVVGIYCNLMTKFNVLRQIEWCKALGAIVVLGGPEPENYAEQYLQHGADFVVSGEGEQTLEELIPQLAQNGRDGIEQIAGLIYLDGDGSVRHNPPRPQLKDLSNQPWPDRAAIDLERYLHTWQTHHGVRSVSLITARGCPYTCTWCSHSVFGQTHRRRSVEDVADEVEWIANTYSPDQLWYADDVFTIVPRWTIAFAAELKKRNIHIPFECISRPDRLNEKVIAALAEMGCYRLWLGAESGSQRILDGMKRKTQAADVQEKSLMLQAAGIEVGMFIMLGYEGEEIQDIEDTVDHLKKSRPNIFLTTVSYPIKGTKYYEAVEGKVTTHLAWEQRSDRDLGVEGRFSAEFYAHATRYMVNEVTLHKERLAGSRNVARLGKLYLNAQRGRIGMQRTQHQREVPAGGTGWTAEERATDGW